MPKSRQQKREEAEERRAAYLSRSPSEQMNLVRGRPGENLKERDKLIEKIEQGDKL